MGKEVVNGGLEPLMAGSVVRWGIYAGVEVGRHAAPPDGLTIDDDEARALCERASRVDHVELEMALPAIWRPWWGQLTQGERVAVWRGCRALWAWGSGPRW